MSKTFVLLRGRSQALRTQRAAMADISACLWPEDKRLAWGEKVNFYCTQAEESEKQDPGFYMHSRVSVRTHMYFCTPLKERLSDNSSSLPPRFWLPKKTLF